MRRSPSSRFVVALVSGIAMALAVTVTGTAGPVPAEASPSVEVTASAPNDKEYPNQWGLAESETQQGIGVAAAWAVTTGGPGVVVAVIDTGVNRHPDLKRVLPGWDFVGGDTDITEDDGGCYTSRPSYRGTQLAGIIAAASNNRIGGVGVAPNVSILPIRAFNQCGSGNSGDVDAALLWAAGFEVPTAPPNPYPAKVIVLSSGFVGACSMQATIDRLVAAGVIVVASAGSNHYVNQLPVTDVWTPANCNDVITVVGGTPAGDRISGTNYGAQVEITAPGSAILAPSLDSAATAPWKPKRFGTGYTTTSGSGAAAAHVAGVAALAASVDPGITPAEFATHLAAGARPFPEECTGCGAGLLDAGNVISSLTLTPGVIHPAPQGKVILGAKTKIAFAGVAAKKVSIRIAQGSTNLPLASIMVTAGIGDIAIPATGLVPGAATLTFTPETAMGATPLPASFSVPIELAAPRVDIHGPYSSLALGIKRTVSWSTTGSTKATGALVLVKPNGQELVLKPSVKLAKGSYIFNPTATLGTGTFTFVLRPTAGSGIVVASRQVPVSSLSATGYVTLDSPAVGSRGALMVSTDFVGVEVPVTVSAIVDGRAVKLTTAKLKVGSGSVPFVIPPTLGGATITFAVTTLLPDTTIHCRTLKLVGVVLTWVPCDTVSFKVTA